jgi:CRISPR-associated protein Cmr4
MATAAPSVKQYWLHALTPLHVGSGRAVGVVDLPIVREAVTNWPYVPGSAVKGVLADHYEADAERGRNPAHPDWTGKPAAQLQARKRRLAFGTAGDELSNAGSIVFADARLVCLPVRSLYGTFAWCTSRFALARLQRDLARAQTADLPVPAGQGQILVSSNTPETTKTKLAGPDGRVYLEDLDLASQPDAGAHAWGTLIAEQVFSAIAWRQIFLQRFAIIDDDVFSFLSQTATQVDARVRIDDDAKTVAKGQLWYEESLPAETVLSGLAWCGPVFRREDDAEAKTITQQHLMDEFCSGTLRLQIGGKATVGRGQVEVAFESTSSGGVGTRA